VTTIYFHSNPRKRTTLVIGLILLLGVTLYALAIPPTGILQVSIFFTLLLAAFFYLFSFLFNQRRLALLMNGGVALTLILRLLELRSLSFPILIFTLVIAIELFIRKSQKR